AAAAGPRRRPSRPAPGTPARPWSMRRSRATLPSPRTTSAALQFSRVGGGVPQKIRFGAIPRGGCRPGERGGGTAAPTRRSSGDLRLDLAQVSFDVVVQARSGLPDWRFAWKSSTPDTKHVRIRLVRAGTIRAGEPAKKGLAMSNGWTPSKGHS